MLQTLQRTTQPPRQRIVRPQMSKVPRLQSPNRTGMSVLPRTDVFPDFQGSPALDTPVSAVCASNWANGLISSSWCGLLVCSHWLSSERPSSVYQLERESLMNCLHQHWLPWADRGSMLSALAMALQRRSWTALFPNHVLSV